MSPKMHQYLFVYSEKDGSFPVRLRVIEDAQSSEIPFDEKLLGTVDKADIDEYRTELIRRYPAPEFRVATSWANKWGAVQRNYAGLDYEYESPGGRDGGPPRTASSSTNPKDAGYFNNFVCPECGQKALKVEKSIELGSDSRSDECSLQAVRCNRCDLVGVVIYEESRRGAGESVNHYGYRMDNSDYKTFLMQLSECRHRGKATCSCEAHTKFGAKNEHGTLRPLEMVQHDKMVFPMKFQ